MSTLTDDDLGGGQTKPSRLRDWFWTPVAPCLMAVFLAMPVRWIEPLGKALGRLWSLAKRERKIMRRNFSRVLNLDIDSPEGQVLARNVYCNQLICAMESIRSINQPELVKIEGLAELRATFEKAEAAGKGQLLVTAHLGSWEIIEIFMPGFLRGKFYELAKPMRIKAFTKHLEQLRLKAGTYVLWNNQKLLLRKMLRILRAGDTLGLACDQKPKNLLGPVVEFFGRPTEFVGGPGSVAERTGCAVIAVFCTRICSFTYRLTTEVLYEPSDEKRDAHKVTQEIASSIERAIRSTPDQWIWTYRRWIYEDDAWHGPRGENKKTASRSITKSSPQKPETEAG